MSGVFIALSGYLAVIVMAEAWYRHSTDALVSRKLAHIGGGIVTASLPFLVDLPAALGFSGLFFVTLLISQKHRLIKSIYDERNELGSLYFPLGMGIAAAVFWDTPAVFSGAALLFAIPDGIAGYVGKRFGAHAYAITGAKTLEGSLAYFVSTVAVLYLWTRVFDVPFILTPSFAVGYGIVLSTVEGLFGRGTDNLFLPLIAGLLLLHFT